MARIFMLENAIGAGGVELAKGTTQSVSIELA